LEEKNLYKKLLLIISIIIIVFIFNICFANSIIYKNEEVKQISSGTYLKTYRILTEDGWIDSNVIELDLNDDYSKIKLLVAGNGNGHLDDVRDMVRSGDALAGINADFFSGRNGIGHSIGISIDNGEVISSAAKENNSKDTMASLLLDENNKVYFEYIKNNISIYSPETGGTMEVSSINKYTDNANILSIYTNKFGDTSIAADGYTTTEMIVENDKVVEIRNSNGRATIPSNGYVVMGTNQAGGFLWNNFKVGSKVKLNIELIPNIEKIKFAISGGAKLVENGEIPLEFTHSINGRNPRTAIGTNKANDKVYLITVDGRTSSSIGMTMEEFAEFIKSLSIYNAINLDGGGSTTMVAKLDATNRISVINYPSSGGVQRLVTNGVGIYNTAPSTSKIDRLEIELEDDNVFVGEKRKFKIIGYNKYDNFVDVDLDDVKLDYDGVELEFESGEVIGKAVGKSNIIAKIGKVKTTKEINILSEINEIIIKPKDKSISPGEEINYSLIGKNIDGYYAKSNQNEYKSSIYKYYKNGEDKEVPKDASIDNLKFTASTPGTYILSFESGTCTSFAKVKVLNKEFKLVDDFEEETFSFDPYPDEVGGRTELSSWKVYNGDKSVILEYDFDREIAVRGAYIVFNEPYEIPKEATALSFMLYNEEHKEEKLKMKIIDANDNTRILVLQDNIDHDGWKEITVGLSNIALPIKVTDIYLAQNDISIKNNGYVFVDRFGYYTNKIEKEEVEINIPKDKKIEDQNNRLLIGDQSFKIAFLDTLEMPNLMIDDMKNKILVNSINKNVDFVVTTTELSSDVLDNYFEKNKVLNLNSVEQEEDDFNTNFENDDLLEVNESSKKDDKTIETKDNKEISGESLEEKNNNNSKEDEIPWWNRISPTDSSMIEVRFDNYKAKSEKVSEEKIQELLDDKKNPKVINKNLLMNKNYNSYQNDDCTIITMDISLNSIRKTDSLQYIKLKNDIDSDKTGNIIIVLNNTIDDFSDLEERNAFVDILCNIKNEKNKNIYIVHNGYYSDFSMERGIVFLGLNNKNILPQNVAKDFSYLLISVTGSNISYEYKKVF